MATKAQWYTENKEDIMQDAYTAMMTGQQRQDPFKSYTSPPRSNNNNGTIPPNTTAGPSYYSMPYGSTYGNPAHDNYHGHPSLGMSSSLHHDFSPLPAHMGSSSQSNNAMSRINPTTHTITHTQTSPPSNGSGMHGSMSDISSPLPSSSSRISLSPDGHNQSQMSSPSPSESSSVKPDPSSNSSDSDKRDNTDDDISGIPPKKRLHTVPPEQRDTMYWEKRKKNNESAKRSREARRMKEEQIALRVVYLEQENLQLRTEVSLLKSEIEKLRCMLYNS